MRVIHPETTLVWFIFLYLSLGWMWIAQTNPNWTQVDYPMQPQNEFLRFFLVSWLILCIVCVQRLINWMGTQCKEPDSLNFSLLCTLANCSVLMMTEKYHGYYIHGKAPWEKSDLPMSWLKMELDLEGHNKRGTRAVGADAGLDAQQTQG